jgi:hypothetical protein
MVQGKAIAQRDLTATLTTVARVKTFALYKHEIGWQMVANASEASEGPLEEHSAGADLPASSSK